ncbi:Imidazoleglycerol-phosphate dehydratase [uncultured archaeon]|nr:Imidazoleglycerol-phosphate dehydratase [uncultured archaeon]
MKSSFKRDTKETKISVTLDLDGSGSNEVATGIELLDEILVILAKASGFDLTVRALGDLATGDHHTTEDVGIALGSVLGKLIRSGIGSSLVPSGECLALAAVRFGEPGYSGDFEFCSDKMGGMVLENFGHFARSVAYNGRFTLHLSAKGCGDRQKIDALTVALGRALRRAAVDGMQKK